MKYILHVYINEADMQELQNTFSKENVCFFDAQKNKIDVMDVISREISRYYIGYNNGILIEYIPCFYTLHYIQPATLKIENPDSDSLKLFLELKKYVRKNYFLSSDKTFYMGKNMFNDWIDNKYYFPVLFSYKEFSVDESEINTIFTELIKENYSVKNNKVRLRNVDELDMKGESFIIYPNSSELITTIIRKSVLNYEYGSQCVFVYHRKKQKKYIFYLDQRIEKNNFEITLLYEEIKKKWTIMHEKSEN